MTRIQTALIVLAAATAAPQPQYFRYERPVSAMPRSAETSQTCAVLDSGVFAHAAPGLADLRLYRGDAGADQETPFLVRQSVRTEEKQQTVAAMNLGHKGAHTTFEAAMPDGRYSDVTLDVTGKDFIATVAVTGAQTESGREGTELGLFTIFDLSAQKLGRSTVLHLPESDFRYLYFSIAGPVKPEQIGGLSIEQLPESQQAWTVVAQATQITQRGRDSVVQFSVPAHVPVERVEFVAGDTPKNFSREVSIKVVTVPAAHLQTDEEPPQPVESTGNLLRIHGMHGGHQIDEERLTVDAPWASLGNSATTWTVTIDNGDDRPLAISAVRLEMAERTLCFDAAAGAHYMLFYGDAALAAPRYDYATLFTLEKNASIAQLGPEEQNPDYRSRPDERPFTERHPALLWAGLILVIVVLGGVALRTAKSTRPPASV